MNKRMMMVALAVTLGTNCIETAHAAEPTQSGKSPVNVGEVNGYSASTKSSPYKKKTKVLHTQYTNKQVFRESQWSLHWIKKTRK